MGLIKGPTPVQIGGNIIQFESAEEACFGMLDAKRDGLMGRVYEISKENCAPVFGG
tara:strand:+ start:246 stop:413 length:168 start_codon:yes stop_codon:yes gene_type:complete